MLRTDGWGGGEGGAESGERGRFSRAARAAEPPQEPKSKKGSTNREGKCANGVRPTAKQTGLEQARGGRALDW